MDNVVAFPIREDSPVPSRRFYPPTLKMASFAERLSNETGLALPENWDRDIKACQRFINAACAVREQEQAKFLAGGLVPFGLYKGEPVESVKADARYMKWLMAQTWVQERYPAFFEKLTQQDEAKASA
jgi:hypothetical protein